VTAADLRASLDRSREKRPADSLGVEARRLEVIAAERDVSRFLAGKNPPTEHAATKLAEIIVRDRLSHEEVGTAFVADPIGFELACRNGWQRLAYRCKGALSRALG
jgi:hypothetical protein